MNSELLALFSALFGLICIGTEVRRIIHSKQIRIRNLFLIMYGITYGIVLSLLLTFNEANIYQTTNYYLRFNYTSEGIKYSAWWFFAAVVGYASFRFAGTLRIKKNRYNRIKELQGRDNSSLLLERLQITSIVCLLIGIICFLIWADGWGGYANLFLNAKAIRNGSYGIKNPVAFFAKPAQIVATVSIISIYLIKQGKHVGVNRILFIISFAFSLLYYIAKDGRMVMAMYLLIVLFMWNGIFEQRTNVGKKLVRLSFAFFLFVVIVLNMDRITFLLRYGSSMTVVESSVLEDVMDELAYIYVAGQTSIKQYISEGSPLLIGHDIVSSLFAWVPSALTPDGLIDIWDYNTHLIAGRYATAQFPSDLISTAIYDLGILGPIVLPGFWGALISKLDRINLNNKSPLFIILYYSLSVTILRAINYSMFSATIASVFHLFVAAVVFWVMRHIKWR